MKDEEDYIQRDYIYDIYGRVLSMKYYNSCNTDNILEQYEYVYDKKSNIICNHIKWMYDEHKRDEIRLYKYDNMDRLIKTDIKDNLTYIEKSFAYVYDAVGNRIKETVKTSNIIDETELNKDGEVIVDAQEENVLIEYTYNELNQLTKSVEKNNERVSIKYYEYDNRGNQIKVKDKNNNVITENNYDVDCQLMSTTIMENGKVTVLQENEYNGEGQRISKTTNGIKTLYFYEGSTLLYTTDCEGNKTSQNIIGPEGKIIASIRYNEKQNVYFYSKDIQGSTSVIIDDEGKYVASYVYSDFGETIKTGIIDFYNEICYAGGVYDENIGLYYLSARYYSPGDSVFLSQDTYRGEKLEPSTWNLYGYCGGNPINYVDPSGHGRVIVSGGIYSQEKKNNGGYYYEFIEPALKEIYGHQSQKINWYIADNGWTKSDKNTMRKVAKKSGNMVDIKVRFFKSKSDLILRLNQKTYETDKITNFTVYSHGFPGYLDFGYNYANKNDVKFKLYSSDIGYIKSSSFNKPISSFYSCKTAADDSKKRNFAKTWQKRMGGTTVAYKGSTDYTDINRVFKNRIGNYAFLTLFPKLMITPSINYPTGAGFKVYGKFYTDTIQWNPPNYIL